MLGCISITHSVCSVRRDKDGRAEQLASEAASTAVAAAATAEAAAAMTEATAIPTNATAPVQRLGLPAATIREMIVQQRLETAVSSQPAAVPQSAVSQPGKQQASSTKGWWKQLAGRAQGSQWSGECPRCRSERCYSRNHLHR